MKTNDTLLDLGAAAAASSSASKPRREERDGQADRTSFSDRLAQSRTIEARRERRAEAADARLEARREASRERAAARREQLSLDAQPQPLRPAGRPGGEPAHDDRVQARDRVRDVRAERDATARVHAAVTRGRGDGDAAEPRAASVVVAARPGAAAAAAASAGMSGGTATTRSTAAGGRPRATTVDAQSFDDATASDHARSPGASALDLPEFSRAASGDSLEADTAKVADITTWLSPASLPPPTAAIAHAAPSAPVPVATPVAEQRALPRAATIANGAAASGASAAAGTGLRSTGIEVGAGIDAADEAGAKSAPATALGEILARPNPPESAPSRATPELRSPVGTQAWARELGAQVVTFVQDEVQAASVRVTPDRMGPIEIHIAMRDGDASVWFGAAHADTRAALEQALPQLREMLAEQGLNLAQSGVTGDLPRENPRDPALPTIAGEASPAAHAAAEDGVSETPPRAALGLVDVYA